MSVSPTEPLPTAFESLAVIVIVRKVVAALVALVEENLTDCKTDWYWATVPAPLKVNVPPL